MFSELPEREARTSRLDPKAGPAGSHPRHVIQTLRRVRFVVPDRDLPRAMSRESRTKHSGKPGSVQGVESGEEIHRKRRPEHLVEFRTSEPLERADRTGKKLW